MARAKVSKQETIENLLWQIKHNLDRADEYLRDGLIINAHGEITDTLNIVPSLAELLGVKE